MCRDANARVTADIVRSAECSRADASSWLKVRSTLYSLYLSHSLDCVTYLVTFTRHSLPLSLSPMYTFLSFSLSISLSHSLLLSLHTVSFFLISLFRYSYTSTLIVQERDSIIEAASARIRALEDDREGNYVFSLLFCRQCVAVALCLFRSLLLSISSL